MSSQHCDGRRKRRHSPVRGRRLWYSYSRGVRFNRRLSITGVGATTPTPEGFLVYFTTQLQIHYQYDSNNCRVGG
jgi:hypothetical protein